MEAKQDLEQGSKNLKLLLKISVNSMMSGKYENIRGNKLKNLSARN